MVISSEVWMLLGISVGVMIGYVLRTIKQIWLDWEEKLEMRMLLKGG